MSVRSNAYYGHTDLHPEFQDILRRNGLQAHVVDTSGILKLVVKGHDSPLLTYSITQQQANALTDWGTNSADKKAYDTLVGLIGNDFHLPRGFVNARNAYGRVATGLHGYGHYDWRQRPGELQAGSYGFYFKGGERTEKEIDVLAQLKTVIQPVSTPPRSTAPAIAYSDFIMSDVYFTGEKWQEVLSSHGLIINADKKTLTVQSAKSDRDFVYDLTDAELSMLTSDSLSKHSVNDRIVKLNDILATDFKDAVTFDRLNSTERIGLEAKVRLTAVADGESVTCEMTERQYDKFVVMDDMHREKMLRNLGIKIPAMLLAGLAITRDLVSEQHHFEPALFAERVYHKTGVDNPMDVASRCFEAQMLHDERQLQMSHGL